MTHDQVKALFTLAEIDVLRIWKLPNGYVGDLEPLTDEEVARDILGTLGAVHLGAAVTQGVVRNWMNDYRWRFGRPAWLVQTPYGLIEITPRKRVTDINWIGTSVRAVVTDDDTTKDDTRVHAWSEEKMIEYLKRWHAVAKEQL